MVNKEELTEIVKQVISEYDKQQREKDKKRKDRRLRNTHLLLKNYNNLLIHIDYAIDSEIKIQEDTEEMYDPDSVEYDDEQYELIYINAIKRTKTRTRIIVKHIETAIEFYKQKSNIDNISKRRYEVLNKYYFENKKISEIAIELDCSEKTIVRDKNKAVEELSSLFFGIDGIKFGL